MRAEVNFLRIRNLCYKRGIVHSLTLNKIKLTFVSQYSLDVFLQTTWKLSVGCVWSMYKRIACMRKESAGVSILSWLFLRQLTLSLSVPSQQVDDTLKQCHTGLSKLATLFMVVYYEQQLKNKEVVLKSARVAY